MNSRFRSAAVRFWRLLVLAGACVLLRHAPRQAPPPGIGLAEAQAFFPKAAQLRPLANGAVQARDADGTVLGSLVTTAPQANQITGYVGPSNLLVALDPSERISGIQILDSADTPAHLQALRADPAFARSLIGWRPGQPPPQKIEGISGSTLTGLAMVEGIALRLTGKSLSLRFPDPVTLEETRRFFPNTTAIQPDSPRPGWFQATDSTGETLGFAVRTSPAADTVTGYAGPSECLVAVEPDQKTLRAVALRKSYDTPEYVERVTSDRAYLPSLTQWNTLQWQTLDFGEAKIEGVAGATQTSYAVAEGLRQKFSQDAQATPKKPAIRLPDLALGAILCGAVVLTFSGLRGGRKTRMAWQGILIAGLGIWLGHFLSLGLLVGWSKNTVPWREAAPLVLLAGAALILPWGTRRQWYCHHVCPHGAAQEWLGRLSPRTVPVPARLYEKLRLLPGLILAAGFLLALCRPGFALSNLEPFDFWILGTAALVPAVLAVVGLVASLFVPMAYCRFGCPTGALLGFLRTTSQGEKFASKDACAALLLLLGTGLLFWKPHFLSVPRESAPLLGQTPVAQHILSVPNAQHILSVPKEEEERRFELGGAAFGTTWCVKFRSAPAQPEHLRSRLNRELERIESTLSHWRKDSRTSQFNALQSTQPQPISEEMLHLVSFALQLSALSQGAYDITVAPLTAAWGYGPEGSPQGPPSDSTLATRREAVGWNKLRLDPDEMTLAKSDPALALDLGSILQGYAVDQIAGILDAEGCSQYLVEVGGELRARGAWTVAIENPAASDRPLQVLTLKDSALATSGLARARRTLGNLSVSHLISAQTGRPVEGSAEMCSVRMKTCLEADAWATALLASPWPQARDLAQQEGVEAWFLDKNGEFEHAPAPENSPGH
jgi:thiamine biosynthesis lipoprotein ApbE